MVRGLETKKRMQFDLENTFVLVVHLMWKHQISLVSVQVSRKQIIFGQTKPVWPERKTKIGYDLQHIIWPYRECQAGKQ